MMSFKNSTLAVKFYLKIAIPSLFYRVSQSTTVLKNKPLFHHYHNSDMRQQIINNYFIVGNFSDIPPIQSLPYEMLCFNYLLYIPTWNLALSGWFHIFGEHLFVYFNFTFWLATAFFCLNDTSYLWTCWTHYKQFESFQKSSTTLFSYKSK